MRVLNVEPLRYDPPLRALLGAAGEVDFVEVADDAALADALGRAPYEALFTRLGLAVGSSALAACPSLRWVVTPTTGVDHLDLTALERAGVGLVSLRGETRFLREVRSTAEHTWALLLALVRRLPAAHGDVVSGRWRREPYIATELQGKKLGLVGVGRLGGMVARFGVAFRMHVCGFDRDIDALAAAEVDVESAALEELLETADVVSLHLPLEPETEGFLDAERMRSMKRGALLVNTARGELVDEAALLAALEDGHLGGAALDVLSGDGVWDGTIPDDHPLVSYARRRGNLILTPHVGGYGRDSIAATRRFVIEKFLEGACSGSAVPHLGGDS